jgi:Tfp pilus assembly ATPase PilU
MNLALNLKAVISQRLVSASMAAASPPPKC